jgi:hypothetical protein
MMGDRHVIRLVGQDEPDGRIMIRDWIAAEREFLA